MSVSFLKKSCLSAGGVSRGGIELVEQAIDNANLFPEPNLEIPTRGTWSILYGVYACSWRIVNSSCCKQFKQTAKMGNRILMPRRQPR